MRRLAAVALVFVAQAACSEQNSEGLRCDATRPCPEGLSCVEQRCQSGLPPTDSGAADAALDLGFVDSGVDTGVVDLGPADTGPVDEGGPDASPPDMAPSDLGPTDAVQADSGVRLTAIEITPSSLSLPAGRVRNLTAEAVWSDGSRQDITTQVSWQSLDTAVATVVNGSAAAGTVRCIAAGSTEVQAGYLSIVASATINVSEPVVDDVATFNKHSLVLLSNDEVWAWGWNEGRQVNGTAATHILRPVLVATLAGAERVFAGGTHSAVLMEDGRIFSWGANPGGQLGRLPIAAFDATPAPVRDAAAQQFVAEDVVLGYDFTLALKADGTVWSWGSDSFGSLGTGAMGASAVPAQLTLPPAAQVSAGTYHAVARGRDGSVWTWGYNFYGQQGQGTFGDTTDVPSPVRMRGPGGTGFVGDAIDIGTGWGHTVILLGSTRELLAVGWNVYGQLGNAATVDTTFPVAVAQPTGLTVQYAQIVCGFGHSFGQSSGGDLWTWGSNNYGELGVGSLTPAFSARPERVRVSAAGAPFVGVEKIVGGGDFNLVLKTDGSVWVWGSNVNAELGNGSLGGPSSVTSPIRVTGW